MTSARRMKAWKPEAGDRGPHMDVTLKPFQMLLGTRLGGRVRVDARRLGVEEHVRLRQWVGDVVECRLTMGATLTVLYD